MKFYILTMGVSPRMADISAFPINLRVALRELKGGYRQLRLFIICLMLGVAVMSCIGALIAGVKSGIERDAGALLGGDIEVRQLYTPLDSNALAHMRSSGSVSNTQDMRTMVSAGEARALVDLKAVDRAYPLYGAFQTDPALPYDTLFGEQNGHYGLAVEAELLTTLNARIGDHLRIGDRDYTIRATIVSEPDRSLSVFNFGVRAMTGIEGFNASGLLQFGSLVNYRYRLKLAEGDMIHWQEQFKGRFPEAAGWGIRNRQDAAPMFSSLLDRLSLFFSFTGLTTLLTAGLGISNAVNAYLLARRKNIATLKCLGASQRRIYGIYLLQLLLISLASITAGLLIGYAAQLFLTGILEDFLQLRAGSGFPLRPLALAAGFGWLTVLLFSFFPLQRTAFIKPASLFRDTGGGDSALEYRLPRKALVQAAGIALPLIGALVYLAYLFTGAADMVAYFTGGIAAAMAVFYAIGLGIKRLGRASAHRRSTRLAWTMALSNLSRPGSAVTSISIALGLGISLLTALTLVGGNLRNQFESELPIHAPAFFLIDIQPSQIDSLLQQLKTVPGVSEVIDTPMIRGRITKLNGAPADENAIAPDARWAVRGDRGVTWSAAPPANAKLVEGQWWPPDYQGPPLVSFDAKLARGMHLRIGDTITVTSMGKEITATIHNLRTINWGTLEMNFATILSPGAAEGLPPIYLASVAVTPDAEKDVLALLNDRFPSVSIVRVKDALQKMSDILGNVSKAVLATAAVTILCGILVMASALSASLQRRVYDTVLLKVLGIRRRMILRILLLEMAIISLSVSGISLLVGTAAAYGIMQLMIFSDFQLLPGMMFATLTGSLLISILLGLALIRRVLLVRPLSLLRNE